MEKVFTTGFYRVDITPEKGGIPLAGYGATNFRLAAEVIDRINANIIAVGYDGKPEIIMITLDWINVTVKTLTNIRKAVSEATGVAEKDILVGGTHTHSGPDPYSRMESILNYHEEILPKVADGARRAVTDMKPTKIFSGQTEVGHEGARLNFVRHYKMVPVAKKDCYTEKDLVTVGDGFGNEYAGNPDYCYVGHEEEADHSLSVLKFDRGDADSIIIVNFAAHATVTGGAKKTQMSSDYPGTTCLAAERIIPHSHVVFYNGCAGNVNPKTRMPEEGMNGLTYGQFANHRAYGEILAAYVEKTVRLLLHESPVYTFDHRQEIMTVPSNRTGVEKRAEAEEVTEVFHKEAYSDNVKALCRKYGFNSPYQCNSILGRVDAPETRELELNILRFGDAGLVTAPFELFNTLGLMTKEKSPFEVTIVKSYSCGRFSYLPSLNTYNDSYGYNCMQVEPGTGEKMAELYGKVLTELKENM